MPSLNPTLNILKKELSANIMSVLYFFPPYSAGVPLFGEENFVTAATSGIAFMSAPAMP